VTDAMTRAALYARYSSDLQSITSIEDQLRVCRERAAREGWQVSAAYDDPAISGAHIENRPGIQRLLADARAGRFDLVLTEAIDRLARDQEHIAWLYKRLRHAGVKIVTLADGEISAIHIGLKGTMAALFLEDLAAKVKRGQRGQVERGRAAGGLAYGYRVVRRFGADGRPETGLREIDPAQAAIVRRIFAEYVAGASSRMIAAGLNRDRVAGPRGGAWNQSTINGARGRGRGILHNELYVGRVTYGRASFAKDPDTGRRREVKSAAGEVLTKDAPELRIVDQDLWDRAQRLKALHAHLSAPKARRPKRLLSGLVACGCCGSPYIVIDSSRMGCAGRKEARGCAAGRYVRIDVLEREVLAGLQRHLLAPEAISAYVREYHRLRKESQAAERRDGRSVERRAAELATRIGRLVKAIGDGTDSPALRRELLAAEAELAGLEQRRQDEA
jgi:site-specific DNA recombinase